jgi:hypothetical protein
MSLLKIAQRIRVFGAVRRSASTLLPWMIVAVLGWALYTYERRRGYVAREAFSASASDGLLDMVTDNTVRSKQNEKRIDDIVARIEAAEKLFAS